MVAIIMLFCAPLASDDPVRGGKPPLPLKLTQLQGGFAGFTGFEYTIEPDGTWASVSLFNKKTTPKDKGKLSPKELQAIVELLAKNEITKLPAKAGKAPGANPHTITIEYGKSKATFASQMAPKMDSKDEVESRFATIYQGVTAVLKAAAKKADNK